MYYPISQITTGLYSSGELVFKNNTSNVYTGPYWKDSKGKFYTGTTPQDTPIFELTPLIDGGTNESITLNSPYTPTVYIGRTPNIDTEDLNADYSNIYGGTPQEETSAFNEYVSSKKINTDNITFLPTYSPNIPTENDYKLGEYRRYFCKKINEVNYLEINKDTYDLLTNKSSKIAYVYYQSFNIPWRISNIDKTNVGIINSNIVKLTMFKQRLPLFDKYLNEDYTKYYK